MSAAPSDTCDVRSFVASFVAFSGPPIGGTDVRAVDGDKGGIVSKGGFGDDERGLSGAGSRWGDERGTRRRGGVWSYSDTSRSGTAVFSLARGSTYESEGVGGKSGSWVDEEEEEWLVEDAIRESCAVVWTGDERGSSARDGAREMEGAEPWDGGRLRDGVKERGLGDLPFEREEERLVMTGVLSLPLKWTYVAAKRPTTPSQYP